LPVCPLQFTIADMSKRRTSQRGVFVADVIANDAVCDAHYLLSLAVDSFPATRPGQFIQVQCRPVSDHVSDRPVVWRPGEPPVFKQPELTKKEPMLRRPFSLAGRREQAGLTVLDVMYRTIGTGTTWLAGVAPGDRLSILGPLGNAFEVKSSKKVAAVIGGGVGIPPMIYLAEALVAEHSQVIAFCGVQTARLLPLSISDRAKIATDCQPACCVEPFGALAVPSVISTDDGSIGHRGFVNEAFEIWLKKTAVSPDEIVVYCCGPEAMMRAVAGTCIARGIDCQVAMERHMACGMGTCQSCIVKVRDEASPCGWSYKLCCSDGPVFDATSILWQ